MTLKINAIATCVDCCFYAAKAFPTGQCRRKAPFTSFTKTDAGSVMKTIWPLTRDTDWCGDHSTIQPEVQ